MASLIRRHFTSTDPVTGRKTKRMAKKWYGQYTDADGKTHRVPLATNKTAAQQMLNELVRKVERAKAGIVDPFEEHRLRPILAHVDAWEAVLNARKNTGEYVALKIGRVKKIIEACGFKVISDLSASRVEAALADMRREPRFGTQTSNHYLGAVKQFARWLVKDRRTGDNVLSHLSGGNVRLDRRHQRREMTDAELLALFLAARTGKVFRHLCGPDREMLYLTSVYTGLRASELASLTPESFALNANPATLTVGAAYSKHRREDVIPLHDELVRRLRPWLASKTAGKSVWPGKWASAKKAQQMVRHDLKTARAAWIESAGNPAEKQRREESSFLVYRDEAGQVIDFHALRHTFITRLVKAGVNPKEAQALARHSTITLTMDRYAHIGLLDVASAMGLVPSVGPSTASENQALRATGTDDACTKACTNLALTVDSERADMSTDEKTSSALRVVGESLQDVDLVGFDKACEAMRSGGGGIRTLGRLSPSPVFKTGSENSQVPIPTTTSDDGTSPLALPLALEGQKQPQIDPDLQSLISAWPTLPESAQHNLRVVIRSTLKRHGKPQDERG